MHELLLWTWVVGGTPLALALIGRAVERWRDAVRSRMLARTPATRERSASDSSLLWTHVRRGDGPWELRRGPRFADAVTPSPRPRW